MSQESANNHRENTASPPAFALAPPDLAQLDRLVPRVPFGLRGGRMWTVAQVPTGVACGCTCPACGHPLVAKAKDSTRRRPHFAHYRDADCRAGFESSVHRMAKQLVADRLALLLPSWNGEAEMPNPPVLMDDAGEPLYGRRVEFPDRQVALIEAVLEKSQGDYVPDVTAMDEHGRLFIEIRVTHAVDEIKRRRIQSEGVRLVEINLSSVTPNQTFELETFSHAVLDDPSNRVWLSCPPATEEWRESMRDLKARQALRNRDLAQSRQLAEEARQLALTQADAEVAKADPKSREHFRMQRRARYEAALRALPGLVSREACEARLAQLELRDRDRMAVLVGGIASDRVREAVMDYHCDAWIFQVHPVLWQAEVCRAFVTGKNCGDRFNQKDVAQWMRAHFEFNQQLYDLFLAQYSARTSARRSGYSKNRISAWYFTEEENGQIPNFYRPINAFIERLAYIRALTFVSGTIGEVEVM